MFSCRKEEEWNKGERKNQGRQVSRKAQKGLIQTNDSVL